MPGVETQLDADLVLDAQNAGRRLDEAILDELHLRARRGELCFDMDRCACAACHFRRVIQTRPGNQCGRLCACGCRVRTRALVIASRVAAKQSSGGTGLLRRPTASRSEEHTSDLQSL